MPRTVRSVILKTVANLKDAQDGKLGQEPHPRSGIPHANQTRRHYPRAQGVRPGVFFVPTPQLGYLTRVAGGH